VAKRRVRSDFNGDRGEISVRTSDVTEKPPPSRERARCRRGRPESGSDRVFETTYVSTTFVRKEPFGKKCARVRVHTHEDWFLAWAYAQRAKEKNESETSRKKRIIINTATRILYVYCNMTNDRY